MLKVIDIPPLKEADVPRKYKLQARPEAGLGAAIKKLEEAITQQDTRRLRFKNVGEDMANKIRR